MIELKGCQKRIYHIKNIGGKYFDEAYLVLKTDPPQAKDAYRRLIDDIKKRNSSDSDLAHEADVIVREAIESFASPKKKSFNMGKGLAFALGAVSSSALIGTVALAVVFVCL